MALEKIGALYSSATPPRLKSDDGGARFVFFVFAFRI
jgi:hypothetical protein